MDKKKETLELSIVIPVFNEQEVIPILKDSIQKFFSQTSFHYELILINDASTDDTEKLLEKWQMDDAHIRVLHLSENIGHQRAILEGLKMSTGDLIITMDADLQDPLEEIPNMIEKGKEGFEIVHMRRISRKGETVFRKMSAWTYYRIAKIFYPKILMDVGDFRLMTKSVVKRFFTDGTDDILIRKVAPNLSVSQTIIPYHRQKRVAGTSKFSLGKLVQLAFLSGTPTQKK